MEGYEKTGTSLYYDKYDDGEYWTIDSARNIIIPDGTTNMEGETGSQYIPFQMERFQDGIDLKDMVFSVIWNTESGDADSDLCVNTYYDATTIRTFWIVRANTTAETGDLLIQLQATGKNEKNEDYIYRTRIATLQIEKSLDSNTVITPHSELYNDLMNYVTEVLDGNTGVIYAKCKETMDEFETRLAAIAQAETGNEAAEIADARVRKNGIAGSNLGTVIREKADGFVTENGYLYLTSAGIKITEGLKVEVDLSEYLTDEAIRDILKDYIPISQFSSIVSNITRTPTGITVEWMDGSETIMQIDSSNAKEFETVVYDDETKFLHFYDSEGGDVFDPVYIPGGSGSGSEPSTTSRVVLTNTTMINGSTVVSIPTPMDTDVVLSYSYEDYDSSGEISPSAGVATWTVNGSEVAEVNITQGSNSFNVRPYINQGRNVCRVKVTDDDGSYATKTWTVTGYALTIRDTFSDSDIFTGDIQYKYIPTGDLEKTIHFIIDGIEAYTATVTSSGRQQTQIIPALYHGSHTFEVYATAEVNGAQIRSNSLYHDLVCVTAGQTAVIVSSPWNGSVTQYSTALIPFMVYTPGSATSEVDLAVDGETVASRTVGQTMQYWSYKPLEAGNKVLTISSGGTTKTINLVVNDAGIEVNPVTNGLAMDLNPQGHSNQDADRAEWSSKGITVTASEGFDWVNGGFQNDEDGNTYFGIKAGDRLTVNYNLFGDDARKTGKCFNFMFLCENVANYDAEILSCVSDGIGLQMNAQNAIMKTQQTTMDIPYCEEKYLEFGLNILPDGEFPEIVVWLNGTPARVALYASTESFTQTEAVPITIGSDDCDVRIYRIQAYTTNLTDDEQMDNFIANARDTDEMVDRYNRNDICDEYGNIDPDILAQKHPGLRVIKMTVPRFTTGKKDTVTGCTIEHIMSGGGNAHNWIARNCKFKGQGTSSEYYGDSARNMDFDFSESGFDLSDGTHIEKYAMTDNSVPINYFNCKVNVASSENANNAVMADDFNTYQPYLRNARKNDARVRDTMEFHPCVIFVQDQSGVLFGDTKMHLYAAGDLGNSKKNSEAMGMDTSNPNECIVEILNNTALQCRFKSDDLTGEEWGGKQNFEFRYEPENVAAAKAAWQEVLTWVVSTDPEQASGLSFPSPVTYGGTRYTKDTAEYRRAKFKAEVADHFVVDTLLYHYLFTERHSMVDNRAKNTFVHSEDLVHWDYVFNYDDDTADGNDNEGGLTLRYGLEDTDTIGTKNVFNAADSVLWCNVRDCMFDELQAMYISLESKGAWDKDRILQKFEEYQSLKPERLVIADMRRKYFRPYEENGVTSYLPMMYGTKGPQREQYETYQAPYIASKYQSNAATADVVTLRCYTPSEYEGVAPQNRITLTPYADMYLGLRAGSRTYRQRAVRGQTYELAFDEIGSLNDTEVYVYSAGRISAIGNLAALYVGYCNFAAAKKLIRIEVGSSVTSYSNTNFTSFTAGNLKLLRYLDLQGLPNLKSQVDLSGCVGLRELYAKRSGITGVVFATGGLLQKAELPAPASLTMRDLSELTSFSLTSYANLKTLRLENCPLLDSKDFVERSTALTRVRITDIDWDLDSLDLLTRILGMAGLDEADYNREQSVLSGSVHVDEIYSYQQNKYNAAWPYLEITADNLIRVYEVVIVTPEWTDVQQVQYGDNAVDPTTRNVNRMPDPVKEPTVDTVYTWAGWDKLLTGVTADRTINAVFTESVRTYTVRYLSEGTVLQTSQVEAYGSPSYLGEKPVKPDRLESFIYYLFDGWDNEPAQIVRDTDINAVYIESVLPAVVQDLTLFDYAYSDDLNDSMAYTKAEIYAMVRSGRIAEYLPIGSLMKMVPDTPLVVQDSIIFRLHSYGHYEKVSGGMSMADFYMVDALPGRQMNSTNTNVGGWDKSLMREWLNETLFPAVPVFWQTIAAQTYTLANAGNKSYDILKSADYYRIPSNAEVGFSVSSSPYMEEVSMDANELTFSCYTDNASRIKKVYTGTATEWWLRSASVSGTNIFSYVTTSGGINYYGATNSKGVCVGFSV